MPTSNNIQITTPEQKIQKFVDEWRELRAGYYTDAQRGSMFAIHSLNNSETAMVAIEKMLECLSEISNRTEQVFGTHTVQTFETNEAHMCKQTLAEVANLLGKGEGI